LDYNYFRNFFSNLILINSNQLVDINSYRNNYSYGIFSSNCRSSCKFIFIVFLSLAVGILSGLFGVGGGFLMTPFLIFLGIPPSYAVANEANNILGTSVSGSTTHYFKGTLDYKMGFMIVLGVLLEQY
jgi:hypothetical protein